MSKTLTTTDKANWLLNNDIFKKNSLAEELGISRPTLDTRLSGESSWKKLEENWIKLIVEGYGS